jgi:hypothetical protein
LVEKEGINACARERKRDWEKREGLGLTVVVGNER